MEPSPLLSIKLHFPAARDNLIPRPRLFERFEAGIRGPLTLISAPAGFGKTTLLSEWHAGNGRFYPAAWLSLDAGDNDPQRFLVYLTAALETIKPGQFGNTSSLLQAPAPPPLDSILSCLIDELSSFPEDMILVLDDLHMINAQPIQAALSFLVDHLPTQVHLVILTRSDPLLPLARLRARNQLIEIRAEHLRFTLDEATIFLKKVMGLALSGDDIAALEYRAEGWIAGLQLAALSMQGREDLHGFVSAFTGSHHFILDYLSEEVLGRQPDSLRSFLLQTSILETLSAALCDTLTGRSDGQAMLEELERSNLFLIALDDERLWYRYHHLFADVLRNRLRQESPYLVSDLHSRAARWFASNNLIAQAVSHALAAGDQAYAAELIDQHAAGMLMRGEMVTLLSWIKSVDAFIPQHPGLRIAQAWALAFTGQRDLVEGLTKGIERQATARLTVDPDGANVMQGEVAALRAYLAAVQGDTTQALENARLALRLLPETNLNVRGVINLSLGGACWLSGDLAGSRQAFAEAYRIGDEIDNVHLAISGLTGLADLSLFNGRLRQARELYQQAIQLASGAKGQPLPIAAEAFVGLGNLFYEWNDIDAAAVHLEKGVELSQLLGRAGTLAASKISLARLQQAQGDLKGAAKLLQEAETSVRISISNPAIESTLAAGQLRLWLASGDLEPARQLVSKRGLDIEQVGNPLLAAEYLMFGHLLLAQDQSEQAFKLANALLQKAEPTGQAGLVVGPLIMRAFALKAAGDLPAALATLEQALSLGETERYARSFLDEGPHIAELLRRVAVGDAVPGYAARLLSAMSGSAGSAPPASQHLIEPLSDRELQVLHLVAAGMSNQEIADELVLAKGTIKKHLNNIFGKLEAQNRTQCVARARELGLL
jgi:ATP/maltotriose-dependent transcriptional regulator MalT